jgi:hypothetical protein
MLNTTGIDRARQLLGMPPAQSSGTAAAPRGEARGDAGA